MKFEIPFLVMALAAMGPARVAPPPAVPATTDAESVVASPVAPDLAAAPVAVPARDPDGEVAAPVVLPQYDADEIAPDDLLWRARPVVVFADTPADPAFGEQMQALAARPDALVARDVVIITDTDPGADSAWRTRLRPSGFSLVIMDTDGQVKQRKPQPWDVREITRAIDKFPQRRQEIGRGSLLR